MNEINLIAPLRFVFEDGKLIEDASSSFPSAARLTHSDNHYELHLGDNVVIDQPLQFIHRFTNENNPTGSHTIVVGKNSLVMILEEFVGTTSYNRDVTTVIQADVDAHIYYHKLQNETDFATHTAAFDIHQAKDSLVKMHLISLGAKEALQHITVKLKEDGARCDLRGLYWLNHDAQLQQHLLQIDHLASHTESQMHYKGILNHKSTANFTGKVHVHQLAQKVNAEQSNHNLLLSPLAEVSSKPELEIYADDVKCKHGATVGQLDENALFFLCSRGISEAEAKKMLIEAFAEEVIKHITHPTIRQYVEQQIRRDHEV